MKQPDIRGKLKKKSLQEHLSINHCGISSPLVYYYYYSNFLAMKTPKNTEEDPDDPEPADEGDIQMEYSFESCTAQVLVQ
jgi:hypothetical protein